jgi:hypothetical protein
MRAGSRATSPRFCNAAATTTPSGSTASTFGHVPTSQSDSGSSGRPPSAWSKANGSHSEPTAHAEQPRSSNSSHPGFAGQAAHPHLLPHQLEPPESHSPSRRVTECRDSGELVVARQLAELLD